jgi:phosphoserine phosphatase
MEKRLMEEACSHFKQTIAFFDVDGTLTSVASVWEYLHRELGIWESQGEPNLLEYLAGNIDYDEFSRRDAMGYFGIPYTVLDEMVGRIPLRAGIQICFDFFKTRGIPIILLSTGLDILVNRIPGADMRIANELLFEDGVCTGKVRVRIPMDGKKHAFRQILHEREIAPDQAIVVGDSAGDLELMKVAGLSIAVASQDQNVISIAHHHIAGGNLAIIPTLASLFLRQTR